MGTQDKYQNVRATRQNYDSDKNYDDYLSKRSKRKIINKIKKSVFLIIISLCLVVGLVGGFFLTKYTSNFSLNNIKINGVQSAEVDYAIVDVSQIRDNLKTTKGVDYVSVQEVYDSINIEDGGVKCTFLGIDIRDSITKTYYYREDISFDAVEVNSIDCSVPGVYYIKYTSSHFAFKKTELVRTIIVTGVENDG